ncbi:hypothetical protein Leryth_007056 [Lithospermum erythrorhizon]|nr:hypothetical protein Leryth_007056 [Lithospermum erythrorhizon]
MGWNVCFWHFKGGNSHGGSIKLIRRIWCCIKCLYVSYGGVALVQCLESLFIQKGRIVCCCYACALAFIMFFQYCHRLEEATGLAFKFVIGKSTDQSKMSQLKKEIAEYDDFLLLNIQEEYSKLPYKTLAFFKAAYALYDSDFYVKLDDDVYLRPDRLSLLLAKERSHSQTYLGCMKKGPVFTDPKLKWLVILRFLVCQWCGYHFVFFLPM